jgi:excisionase family DNA binding protein
VQDDLVTVSEIAEMRGRSVRTVQRMIASGRLVPAMQLPGKTGAFLFRRADVEALDREPAESQPEPAA